MREGLFITFEGGDGAGKSTQINLLKEYLEGRGFEVVLTREPGGTRISEKIRDIILDKDNEEMEDMTEAYLYAAARAQLVRQVIRPALKAGKIVICDRFVDSSIAYQSWGRNLGKAVEEINLHAVEGCMPHLTILLKLEPETGGDRIKNRELDRIEMASRDFHKRVYQGYLHLEKRFPERIFGIDGKGTIEEIAEKIRRKADMLLEDKNS